MDGDDMVIMDGKATTGLLDRYNSHQSIPRFRNINECNKLKEHNWVIDLKRMWLRGAISEVFPPRRVLQPSLVEDVLDCLQLGRDGVQPRFQKAHGRHPALMRLLHKSPREQ